MNEILVVDDDVTLAEKFAEIVRRRLGIETASTDDPIRALEHVRTEPIKVVLLDQRMPRMNGTDLYKEIKQLNPMMKAIMLTGEANKQEIGDALRIGFSDYLEKGEVTRLTRSVLDAYLNYHVEASASESVNTETVIHQSRRRFLLFGKRDQFRVASIQPLEERYVADDSWSTVLQINAGEERKYVDELTKSMAIVIEDQSKETVKSTVSAKGFPLTQLAAGLEATLADSRMERISETASSRKAVERNYRLPEEPKDSTARYVKARHLQRAPIYKRFLATVASTCIHCGVTTRYPVTFRKFTGTFATRQEDFYSDNTSAVTNTADLTTS